MHVGVLNGRNLNRLGKRRPDRYGTHTLALFREVVATAYIAGLGQRGYRVALEYLHELHTAAVGRSP